MSWSEYLALLAGIAAGCFLLAFVTGEWASTRRRHRFWHGPGRNGPSPAHCRICRKAAR